MTKPLKYYNFPEQGRFFFLFEHCVIKGGTEDHFQKPCRTIDIISLTHYNSNSVLWT